MEESKRQTVLVVDDEEINRQILKELLSRGELDSREAENGAQALEQLKENQPDLVLLDIQMPEMDGYQVLETLKKDQTLKDIPVIMITSVDDLESVARCITGGAEDYLVKPFDPTILNARIKNSLDKFSALKAEKDLLEKTLTGSIKVMIEILSILRPNIFGQTSRIRGICRSMGEQLKLKELWHLEVASLLSQLGTITLPSEVMEKIELNATLFPNEQKEFEKSPQLGYNLVKNLPRLEKVAEIILHQNVNYKQVTSKKPQPGDPIIPMESFILSLAMEFNRLVSRGMNVSQIMDYMEDHKDRFHPRALHIIKGIIQKEISQDIRSLKVREIRPGMVFMENVMTQAGSQIIAKGQEASSPLLVRLSNVSRQMKINEPIKVLIPFELKLFG